MKPQSQFYPFRPHSPWYERYLLDSKPVKPRTLYFKALYDIMGAPWRHWLHAHFAAAAQARPQRDRLEEPWAGGIRVRPGGGRAHRRAAGLLSSPRM